MRVSKPPEERRQEILETAMRLFTEKGYENTSMRDIAAELGVVQGLCYRYFDSKQRLFEAAMDAYVQECCADFLKMKNVSGTLRQKLDLLFASMQQEPRMRYHSFFHQQGNQALHQQLSIRICQYMYPHILAEVKAACQRGEMKLKDPEQLVSFALYGQIGIISETETPGPEALNRIREYIDVLFASQSLPG